MSNEQRPQCDTNEKIMILKHHFLKKNSNNQSPVQGYVRFRISDGFWKYIPGKLSKK